MTKAACVVDSTEPGPLCCFMRVHRGRNLILGERGWGIITSTSPSLDCFFTETHWEASSRGERRKCREASGPGR